MNIKILKLITGEEVLGEVVEGGLDTNNITLKNTVALVIQPSQQGLQMGFLPWGNMVEGNITLSYSNIIYIGDPKDDLRTNYSSMFGGIVTPPKQLIV
jgi:hypothetical protein